MVILYIYFSKFLVHVCLMIFTALFALRLDGTVQWSYWTVFIPIWFWKFMVITGATVGSYVWWRYPHFRLVFFIIITSGWYLFIIFIIIYAAKSHPSIPKHQRCLSYSMFMLLMKSVTWFFHDCCTFLFFSYRVVSTGKSSANDWLSPILRRCPSYFSCLFTWNIHIYIYLRGKHDPLKNTPYICVHAFIVCNLFIKTSAQVCIYYLYLY